MPIAPSSPPLYDTHRKKGKRSIKIILRKTKLIKRAGEVYV
jgi:ribosomal protein L36